MRYCAPTLSWSILCQEDGYKTHTMRNAIGFVIVLWALSQYFGNSMAAADKAATAVFNSVEQSASAYNYKQ